MRNFILIVLVVAGIFVRRSLFSVMSGGLTKSPAVVSSSGTIPAEFPSDVPIPREAVNFESTRIAGALRVEMNVKQPASTILRFYETELPSQGWQLEPAGDEAKEPGDEQGVIASKNGRFVAAIVTPLSNGTTGLALMVQ